VIGFSFAIYLVAVLAIGIAAHVRTRNFSDYVLGGRSLGPVTTALSAGASDMSGWLLLGLPGLAYVATAEAGWLALGLLSGTWLNWLLVAPRLRTRSVEANDAMTIPAYFAAAFPQRETALRVISAAAILIFFVFYTSSGLVAAGKLFATVFEIEYSVAVVAGIVAVLSYTMLGGFLAVCWTDVLQGLMMMLALAILPVMAFMNPPSGAVDFSGFEVITDSPGVITIISSLSWGLGYFGQPHILARFKAIRSVDDVAFSRRVAVSWTAFCMMGALGVGIAGRFGIDAVLADPERVFIELTSLVFHPLLAGIVTAAILAAIMSTADSQLLVCSSVLAEDCYRALWFRQASPKVLLRVGRLAVASVAIVAGYLALNPDSSVLGLVSYAWAGFGAAFGPVILLSLYWPRLNANGVLAGIVTGAVVVVVWKQLDGRIFDIYEIVPAFAASMFAAWLVSILTDSDSK